mmetsp:Transcript_44226/g.126617  ORF Transcript_44226/g.126617 Transcript_44226/m.126617 type:complete len:219 (+) Transcript_44226:158-814(+)
MAKRAASRQAMTTSAPLQPLVRCTKLAKSGSSATCMRANWFRKTSSRAASSGSGTCTRRSNRPGRMSAGSSTCGRFVAASTTTCRRAPAALTPSISASSWASTRAATPPEPSPSRLAPTASISSKKMMQGAAVRALRKTSRTAFSLSPTYFEKSSGPLMETKFISVSVATAFAIMVFEQPGGPYSSTPRGGSMSMASKAQAWRMGHSTASLRASFVDS